MRYSRCIVAAIFAGLALAVASPALAAGATPITWVPLPAVEPGSQILLDVTDDATLFAVQCGGITPVVATVGGVAVPAANEDWAIQVTLPLNLAPGATLSVTARSCHAFGSQTLTVATPVIAHATAQVVEVGGQETATAGQSVAIAGTGFGAGQGPGFAVLLNRQVCVACQVESWSAGFISVVLPQNLPTAAYRLAVRTSAGTSPTVPLYVLSTSDAQALASGQTVAVPWASGGASSTHPSAPTTSRSGSSTEPADNPGGGRAGHGHGVGWPWLALIGLGSVAAAFLALRRRPRRGAAGIVQVQTPEPETEAPTAAPEAPEQNPTGGDT